jgi:hypothetical protein
LFADTQAASQPLVHWAAFVAHAFSQGFEQAAAFDAHSLLHDFSHLEAAAHLVAVPWHAF